MAALTAAAIQIPTQTLKIHYTDASVEHTLESWVGSGGGFLDEILILGEARVNACLPQSNTKRANTSIQERIPL